MKLFSLARAIALTHSPKIETLAHSPSFVRSQFTPPLLILLEHSPSLSLTTQTTLPPHHPRLTAQSRFCTPHSITILLPPLGVCFRHGYCSVEFFICLVLCHVPRLCLLILGATREG